MSKLIIKGNLDCSIKKHTHHTQFTLPRWQKNPYIIAVKEILGLFIELYEGIWDFEHMNNKWTMLKGFPLVSDLVFFVHLVSLPLHPLALNMFSIVNLSNLTFPYKLFPVQSHWISNRWQNVGWELLPWYSVPRPSSPLLSSCVLMGLYIITTRVEVEEVNDMVPGHKRRWEIGFSAVKRSLHFTHTYSHVALLLGFLLYTVSVLLYFFIFEWGSGISYMRTHVYTLMSN